MKPEKVSSVKHAKNQNAAVAYLRRMPIWQRVVSAVMAFLLAFLLWPADAAKTFRAWADAATEAVAEQEVTPTDGDLEGTDDDPEADIGGEKVIDDSVLDSNAVSDDDELVSNAEAEGSDRDGEILTNDGSPVPNDNPEKCGPYIWNFSAYSSQVEMTQTTTSSTPATLDYADSTKVADLKFIGPLFYASGSTTYYLDGGSTFLSSNNGFKMHNKHKLHADGGSSNPNGIVNKSNYISFTPHVDLSKLVINCASIATANKSRYAVIGIIEANGSQDVKSNNALQEFELKSTTLTDVTFDASQISKLTDNVFKAGKTYYIYSRPHKPSQNNSEYASYGGMQIKKITAEKKPASVELSDISGILNDTITFKLECPAKGITKTVTKEVFQDQEIQDVKFENLIEGTEVKVTATSLKTGRSVDCTKTLTDGVNQITSSDLDLAKLYLTLKGTFENAGTSNASFKLIYGYREMELGEVGAGTTINFEFSGLWGAGMLRAENSDSSISDYDEIYIPENTSTEITGISLSINPEEQNSLWLKNTPWDYEYTGEYVDELIHQKVYYMCPIFGQPDQYIKKYIDPIVYKESEADKWPVAEYPSKVGTVLHVLTDPNGIYSLGFNETGEEIKIPVEGYVLTDTKLKGKTVVPIYEWAEDATSNFDISTQYKCTATYEDFEGRMYAQTVYTDETKWNEVGNITREVVQRPTYTQKGLQKLTATWTLDDEYFYPPQVITKEIPVDANAHKHVIKTLGKEVTFQKYEGNTFPTSAGNWYLTKDVTISSAITIKSDVKVDLNGYAIKITYGGDSSGSKAAITVNSGKSLLLFDCCKGQQGCRHYFTGGDRETWELTDNTNAPHYVDGGVITGATQSAILNEGTLNCEDVQFVGNENSYIGFDYDYYYYYEFINGAGGGAIRSGKKDASTNLYIYGCEFLGNTSQGAGGAVLVGVSNTSLNSNAIANAKIENSHFSDNALLGESSATSGYTVPWGGGALATNNVSGSSTNPSNPVLYITGCNFENNASNYRGGAILLFHGTECHMSDTTITNNRSGLRHETVMSTEVCFNYGGGVNLYTGVSSNYHQAFLYLSGKVIIRHNNSREKKNGVETWHEDNLALQQNEGGATKGYVRFDKNPHTGTFPALDEDSFVGINYAKNYNIDCTKDYGGSMLVGQDLTDPSIKNFYLDDVVNRYKYALLIHIGKGSKNKNATYELWIVSHTHKFNYVTSSSRNNNVFDKLTISCASESDQSAHNINGTYHYFSKCMYGLDPLELKIHSQDGGDDGINKIPYEPGVEHPCIIDNSDEFEEYAGGKYAGDMQYFKKVDNGHGSFTWEQIEGAPSAPGIYKAQQSFYEAKVENNQIVTDYTKQHTIVSNEYEIAGMSLQIEIVTSAEKDYDGTAAVKITGARLKGRIDSEDDVELSTTEGFSAYSESPYVCKNDVQGNPIPWKLVSFDTSKVKLVGEDAWKYSLTGITGTVVINPVAQKIEYDALQLWPKPSADIDAEPYDLVDKMRGLQGSPEVVFEAETQTSEYLPFTEYASLTSDHVIQVTALADVIGKLKKDGGEAEELDSGLLGFYKKAYVKSIAAVDINGDGTPEYKEYTRPTQTNDEDAHVPLTFLSGLYDQTEIHFELGYMNKSGEFVEFEEGKEGGAVMLGTNAIDSAKIVKSKNTSKIYQEANTSKLNFYDITQQTRTFSISSLDANRWEYDSIIDPNGNTWNKDEDGSYDWKDIEGNIDYNYTFKIVFKKLTFPEITMNVTSDKDPQVPLDINDTVTYTVKVKNTGNMDFNKGSINSSLSGTQEFKVEDLPFSEDDEQTFTFTHKVTEADIIAGSFTNNFYTKSWYIDDSGEQYYETPDASLTHKTVAPRYDPPTMTLTANPDSRTTVYYGTEITYTAHITNNSNVSLSGTILNDSLVGAVNQYAILVKDSEGVQKLGPGQTVDVQINGEGTPLAKYKIKNVPASGNILNEAEFVGYINIGGIDKMYSCTANYEHHMGYADIDIPVPISGDLIYNGMEQFGVNFAPDSEHADNASKIEILSREVGRDVGTYKVICKPKAWYQWKGKTGAEALATLEISYEIKPAPLNVYYQKKEGDYTGQPLSYIWSEEEGATGPIDAIVDGFVDASAQDYEAEGATSVSLTTNGSDVLYDGLENVTSYKGNGTGLTQNKLVINTKDNTKLSNYVINYVVKAGATDFEITINPRNLDDKDWIVATSQNDYTYDGQEHSAVASVKLNNPDPTVNAIKLIQGTDWDFDATAEGSVVKATNASKPKDSKTDPGYNAVITAKSRTNFKGSTSVNWKILRKALTFNIPANNLITVFNPDKSQDPKIEGYNADKITCNDPSFPASAWNKDKIKTTIASLSITGHDVGEYKLFSDKVKQSFTYDDGIDNVDNIDESFTFSGGILTITPKSIEGNYQITVNPTNYVFNTTEHNAAVEVTLEDKRTILGENDYSISGQTTGINAGTYSIVVTGKGNYTGSRATVWKISPADVYLVKPPSQEKIYDDKVLTATYNQGITGGTITYTLTTSGVDAGVYGGEEDTSKTLNISYELTSGLASNYIIHNETEEGADQPTLTIRKRPVSFYNEDKTFAYDGKSHSFDFSYISLQTGITDNTGILTQHVATDVIWDAPTLSLDHVGTITAKPLAIQVLTKNTNIDVSDNYVLGTIKNDPGDASITITHRKMEIEVVGNYEEYTYDGQNHNVTGYTVKEVKNEYGEITGLFNPSKLSPNSNSVSTGDQKYFNSTDEDNIYKLLYNGHALSESDFKYSDYNIHANITLKETGGLKINKRDLKFNVVDNAQEDYESQTNLAHIIDTNLGTQPGELTGLVDGDGLYAVFTTSDYTRGTYTYPDGVEVNVQFNNNDYADSYNCIYSATLTISSNIVITIKTNSETKEFNGSVQTMSVDNWKEDFEITATGSDFDIDQLDCSAPSKLSISATNVGTYQYPLSARDFSYVNSDPENPAIINLVLGQFEITPFNLQNAVVEGWKTTPDAYKPDKSQEPTTGSISSAVKIPGTDYVIWLNDVYAEHYEEINAGDYTFKLTPKSRNFTGQFTKDWKINKASQTIYITGNQKTVEYNAYEQYVYGWTSSSFAPENRESFNESLIRPLSSECVASGIDVGEYNMDLDASDFSYLDENVDANFVIVSDGYIDITPAKLKDYIDIVPGETEFTWDNTYKTTIPSAFWKSTGKPFDISNFTIENNSQVDVDEYTCQISWNNLPNFVDDNYDYDWRINPLVVNIDIVGKTKIVDYNGKAQPEEGPYADFDVVVLDHSDLINPAYIRYPSEEGVQETNAGTYWVNLNPSKFKYDPPPTEQNKKTRGGIEAKFVIKQDACLIIKPIDIGNAVFDVNDRDLTYTFANQGPTYSGQYMPVGAEPIGLVPGKDYYVEGQTAQNAGDYNLVISGVEGGNFTGSLTFPWVIKKLPVNAVIKANDNVEVPYDGAEHFIKGYKQAVISPDWCKDKINILPGKNDIVVSGTDMGEYSMNILRTEFTCDNNNIDFSYTVDHETTLTIKDTDWDAFTPSATNLIYNGKEQTTCITVTDGKIILKEGVDFEVEAGDPLVWSGNKGTAVGTYTATIKPIGNFKGANKTVKWKIDKATINIQVNGASETCTYDGEEHTVEGYTVTSDSSLFDPDYVITDASYKPSILMTDAGVYKEAIVLTGEVGAAVNLTYNDTNVNVNVTATDLSLVINKKDATLTKTASKVNDASPLSKSFNEDDFDGLAGEDNLHGTLKTNSIVPATYTVCDSYSVSGFTATYDESCKDLLKNYNLNYKVSLTILSDSQVILVRGKTANYTYDGSEKEVSGFEVPAEFEGKVETVDGTTPTAKGTDAGIYYMNYTAEDFKYTGEGEYVIQYIDGYVNINKKSLSECDITVEPREFVYTGKNQGPIVTVKDGDKIVSSSNYILTNASQVDAGNYNLMITGLKNYTGVIEDGYMWTIRKADATVNINQDIEYANDYVSYEFSNDDIDGVLGEDELSGKFTTRDKEIGTYIYDPINASANGLDLTNLNEATNNYNLSYNVRLNIIKHVLNIDPGYKEAIYNGLPQYILESEVKYYGSEGPDSVGVLPGHAVTVVGFANNNQTNVGKNEKVQVDNVTIRDAVGNDVHEKYFVNFLMGTIKVTPAQMKLKITGSHGSFAYDGKAHTVEGYDAYEVPVPDSDKVTGLFNKDKITTKEQFIATQVNPGKTFMFDSEEIDPYAYFDYNDQNINCIFDYTNGYSEVVTADWDNVVISTTNVIYNGREQNANLKVTNGNQYLVEGTDFNISDEDKAKLTATNAGKVTFKITSAGKYGDGQVKTGTWEIYKADMTVGVSGNSAIYYYDKQAKSVGGAVYKETDTKTGLLNKEDIDYKDRQVSDTNPQISLTADEAVPGTYNKGLDEKDFNYNDDNINVKFTILKDLQLVINKPNIGESNFTIDTNSPLTYNAAAQSPTLTVKQAVEGLEDPIILVLGKDYEIVDLSPQVNVGTYFASIKGIGNYTGQHQNISWQIVPKPIDIKVRGSEKGIVYDGTYHEVGVSTNSISFRCSDPLFNISYVKTASNAKVIGIDAGEYELQLEDSMFSYLDNNINATFITSDRPDLSLVIKPKKLYITAVETKEKDEEALTHNILQSEVQGTVSGQVVTGTAVSYKDGVPCADVGVYPNDEGNTVKFNIAVDGKHIEVEPTNDNESSNYTLDSNSLLKIVSAEEDAFVEIQGYSYEYEYDGTEHEVSEDSFSVSTNIANFDVNKINWTGDRKLKETSVNRDEETHEVLPYEWSGVTATYPLSGGGSVDCVITSPKLIIQPRDISKIKLFEPKDEYKTFEYNRIQQYPPVADGFNVEDYNEDEIRSDDYEISYTFPVDGSVNPGTYIVNLNATLNGNYKNRAQTLYTITPAIRIVKVSGSILTKSFDGNEHSVTGYEYQECDFRGDEITENKLFDDSSISPAKNTYTAKGTNVGTYNMGIDTSKFIYTGNFDGEEYGDSAYIQTSFELVQDGYLKINNGYLTIKFIDPSKEPPTYIYDGTLKTPVYEVYFGEPEEGKKPLQSDDYIISGTTTATNASGEDGYTFTVTGTGIYAGMVSDEAVWYIEKAQRSINITGHQGTKTYNTQEQTVSGFDFEEVIPEGETEELIKADLIDSSSVNTTVSGTNVKWTDGEVGKYEMGIDPESFMYSDDNVSITKWVLVEDGWLQINPCDLRTLPRSLSQESFVYDTTPHNPSITIKNGENTLTSNLTDPKPEPELYDYHVEGLQPQTDIPESGYDYTITVPAIADKGSGNYFISNTEEEGNKITGKWYIVPAKLDIYIKGWTSDDSDTETGREVFPYDGKDHTIGWTEDHPEWLGFTARSDSPLFNASQIRWMYDEEQPGDEVWPSVSSSEVGVTYMGLEKGQFTYLQTKIGDKVPISVEFHIEQDGWIRITNKAITYDDLDPIVDKEYTFTNSDIKAHFDLVRVVEGTKIPLVEGIDYDIFDNVAKYVNLDSEPWYTTSRVVFKGNYSGTLVNTPGALEGDRLYFKINKANLTMIVSGITEQVEYDGKEHIAAGYTLKEKETDEIYTKTGFDFLIDQNFIQPAKGDTFVVGTNANIYTRPLSDFTFSYPQDRNLSVTFELDEAKPNIVLEITGKQLTDDSISVVTEDLVYNGAEQFPTEAKKIKVVDSEVGVLDEWQVTVVSNNESAINANTGDSYYSFKVVPFNSGVSGQVSNYEGELDGSKTGEKNKQCRWHITPKEVTYKFTGDKVYDGKVFSENFTLSKEGTAEGERAFSELCANDKYKVKLATKKADAITPNAAIYPYSQNKLNGSWLDLTAVADSGTLGTNYVFNISSESKVIINPYEIKENDERVIFEMTNELIYNGEIRSPEYKLYDKKIEESAGGYYNLKPSVDYNSTYVPKKHVNYTDPSDPSKDEHYTVDFEAKGNYTGSWGSEWKITPKKVYAYSLDETKDPKITPGARNKEYDGTPCVINEVIGNRTSETHKVSDMVAGDYVNVSWATVGVGVKYDNSGKVAPYVMTDGSTTEVTLTPTDAANSPCYARDYEFLLDAQISIWPRSFDPTDPDFNENFVFNYVAPVYNGQLQMLHPATGPTDPTDLGQGIVYDARVIKDGHEGAWLTTNDFYFDTDSKYEGKDVPLDKSKYYDVLIHGKGNYRDAINKPWIEKWSILPYTIPEYYYEDLNSWTYNGKQYDVKANLPEMYKSQRIIFPGDTYTLDWLTWTGSSSILVGTDAGDYVLPYAEGEGIVGNLTYKVADSTTAQTKANYTLQSGNITGKVRINKQEDPENIKISIKDVEYNGYEQYPKSSDIEAYDYNIIDDKGNPKKLIFDYDFTYYEETPSGQRNVPESPSEKYLIKFKGLRNYEGLISDDIPWTIKPHAYEFTFVNEHGFAYNGKKFSDVSHLVVSPLKGDDKIDVTWTTSGANAGEYYLNYDNENAGTISFVEEYKTPTTYKRNYTPIYRAHVVINQKDINDETVVVDDLDPDTDYPEYTGDVVYPTFHVVDTEVDPGVELVYGEDYIINPGGVDVKTGDEKYTSHAQATENGNYKNFNGTDVKWNVRPKAVDIVVDDAKPYDGEVFASHFKLMTGTHRADKGGAEESVYVNSKTSDAEVGDYFYKPMTNDGTVIFDLATGLELGDVCAALTNFNFAVNEPQITLHITGSPVPPKPTPTPDEPEYVAAQTGDVIAIGIIGLLTGAIVCAFLVLRRRKHSMDKRWNA